MKGRTIKIAACAIALLAAFLFLYDRTHDAKRIYGNDEASIVRVIHSIEGYKGQTIELVGVTDFAEKRYAAFLADNHPGYIQFKRNSRGNYEWESVGVNGNESFSTFALESGKFLAVMNHENRIAKMQVRVNGQLVEKEFKPHQASAAWLEWPPADDDRYEFRDYKYYDEQGNLINS